MNMHDHKHGRTDGEQTTDATGDSLVDPDEQRIYEDTRADGIEDQFITADGGLSLRQEATTPKERGRRMEEVTDQFEEYILNMHATADTHEEKRGVRWENHAYSYDEAADRFARTVGVDRAAVRLWGEDLTTAMVVRRASSYGDGGEPQPPADHLHDLLDGNDAVYAAAERALPDDYARLTVIEPHRDGYAHLHDCYWIQDEDAEVCANTFDAVIDAHLNAVEQAAPRNHSLADAVSVCHDPPTRHHPNDPDGVSPTTALSREACKMLAGFAPFDGDSPNPNVPPVMQTTRGCRRFFAMLWAHGGRVQQWRPDGRFYDFVEASQELFLDGDADLVDLAPDTPDGGIKTVEVAPRPVDFTRASGDG